MLSAKTSGGLPCNLFMPKTRRHLSRRVRTIQDSTGKDVIPVPVRNQTPAQFRKSILVNLAFASFIIFVSLGVGMVGYKYYCNVAWDQAFVDASMILTGMGPVDNPSSTWGKIFAGTYALYSGVIFLSMAAVVLAPALHYFITNLHVPVVSDKDEDEEEKKRK